MSTLSVQRTSFLPQEKWDEIKAYTLAETCSTGVFLGISSFFTRNLGHLVLLSNGATFLITIIAIRVLCAFAEHYSSLYSWKLKPQAVRQIFLIASGCVSMAFGTYSTGLFLLGQIGHAISAKTLFHTQVHIQVQPLRGAKTLYQMNKLSYLGGLFGGKVARMITIIAGPLFVLLFTVACFTATSYLKKGKKHLCQESIGEQLESLAIAALWQEFSIVMPLWFYPKSSGHSDYKLLWSKYGMHPAYAAFSLIALPFLLTHLTCKSVDEKKQHES